MNPTTPNSTDPSHGDPNSTPPAHGANSQSQGDKSPSIDELKRQLAESEAEKAKFLADNQKYREERRLRTEAEKAKEAEDLAKEQQRLKEQGEFKTLAEQSQAKVKELEPVKADYDGLASSVSEMIEAAIKDWPAEAKTFDPGKDAPAKQRLDWMNKAKALVDKLQPQQQTKPGNSPNPKPAAQTPEGYQQKLENQLRASGKYRA